MIELQATAREETPLPLCQGTILVVAEESSSLRELSENLVISLQAKGETAQGITSEQFLQAPLPKPLGGIIYLACLPACDNSLWHSEQEQQLWNFFQVAQKAAPALNQHAQTSFAFFTTITQMDGGFGFHRTHSYSPLLGAFAGLVKTAEQEWPNVRCKAIDLDPQELAYFPLASELIHEIFASESLEVGLGQQKRWELNLVPASPPASQPLLTADDVVLVSGGARGVTAQTVQKLAEYAPATFILLGRSELTQNEPEWLAGLTQPGEMKAAIMKHGFAGKKVSPRELESRYQQHLKNREICDNIAAIERTGAKALYLPLDVRNQQQVQQKLHELEQQLGSITGFIHGAGVLEDRLIVDKQAQQFQKVWQTKVSGFASLWQALTPERLKFVVLFSSVSARAGNRGQADYAMANEVLNKSAQQLQLRYPSCRFVAMNWGPWEGGMVTPQLKKAFQERGVDLIPLEQGALATLSELYWQKHAPVEVTLGATLAKSEKKKSLAPDKTLVKRLAITSERSRVLQDHQIGGQRVVPFALMLEWLTQACRDSFAQFQLVALHHARVLKGIRGEANVEVWIKQLACSPETHTLAAEISQPGERLPILHGRAQVVLGKQPLSVAHRSLPNISNWQPYPGGVRRAYQEVLFHGKKLQLLHKILGHCQQGMVAEIANPKDSQLWWQPSTRLDGYPAAWDAAFQLAILWCWEHCQKVSLPSCFEKFELYQSPLPEKLILSLEVLETASNRMRGNFLFWEQEQLVAAIYHYECTMDASLHDKFKA